MSNTYFYQYVDRNGVLAFNGIHDPQYEFILKTGPLRPIEDDMVQAFGCDSMDEALADIRKQLNNLGYDAVDIFTVDRICEEPEDMDMEGAIFLCRIYGKDYEMD